MTWKASLNKSVPVHFIPYQVISNRSSYLTLNINYTQHNWLQFTIRAHSQDTKLDTKTAKSGHCGAANYKSTDKVALPARYINNVQCRYPQPGPARQIQDIHCSLCQKQPLCPSLPNCQFLLFLVWDCLWGPWVHSYGYKVIFRSQVSFGQRNSQICLECYIILINNLYWKDLELSIL